MMPEEIKAIVMKLLEEHAEMPTGWEGVAAHDWDRNYFDKLFEWLKAEAEKPESKAEIARDAARKVLSDPKASRDAKSLAASALTQMKKE